MTNKQVKSLVPKLILFRTLFTILTVSVILATYLLKWQTIIPISSALFLLGAVDLLEARHYKQVDERPNFKRALFTGIFMIVVAVMLLFA